MFVMMGSLVQGISLNLPESFKPSQNDLVCYQSLQRCWTTSIRSRSVARSVLATECFYFHPAVNEPQDSEGGL